MNGNLLFYHLLQAKVNLNHMQLPTLLKSTSYIVNVPVLNQHDLVYKWELVPICTEISIDLTLGNLLCSCLSSPRSTGLLIGGFVCVNIKLYVLTLLRMVLLLYCLVSSIST